MDAELVNNVAIELFVDLKLVLSPAVESDSNKKSGGDVSFTQDSRRTDGGDTYALLVSECVAVQHCTSAVHLCI